MENGDNDCNEPGENDKRECSTVEDWDMTFKRCLKHSCPYEVGEQVAEAAYECHWHARRRHENALNTLGVYARRGTTKATALEGSALTRSKRTALLLLRSPERGDGFERGLEGGDAREVRDDENRVHRLRPSTDWQLCGEAKGAKGGADREEARCARAPTSPLHCGEARDGGGVEQGRREEQT